jgi:hypothetical protein
MSSCSDGNDAGMARAGNWEDTGELGAWRPMLITSVGILAVGLLWGVASLFP